jgi:transmembrane sensor
MPTHPASRSPRDDSRIEEEASLWLVRRDRGLTPAEQDAYMQWLSADPRHAEVLARHAAALERMMQLYDWQPGPSATANPDLFAPHHIRPWRRWGFGLAAAAALLMGGVLLWRASGPPATALHAKSYLRVNERRALPDGSIVELKDGSRILSEFSPAERRVRLTGEAHFQVAKNSTPFVVVAGGVALHAVGTAFNVRLDPDSVEVLVTEGRVAVAKLDAEDEARRTEVGGQRTEDGGQSLSSVVRRPLSELVAGQRAVVPLTPEAEPRISDVTPVEAKEILAWKAPRLQFDETPLAVAVEEFNRRNAVHLVVGERELRAVPIGGTFRADNPEGFVRVLELTLEIKAVRRDDRTIVLQR